MNGKSRGEAVRASSSFLLLSMKIRFSSGFTLIELLLVIGIIAILASIVIVAINPTKQLGDARDVQRRADVNTILNAVYQYAIDNNGALPGNITTTEKEVCRATTAPAACILAGPTGNGVNLRMLSGAYVVSIPTDPQAPSTSTGTNYTIVKDSSNRVTVKAWRTEQEATAISVTR